MPLDRRITVAVRAADRRDEHGELVPGTVTNYPLWSERAGLGSIDVETTGGVVVSESASWTVRWFRELAIATPDRVAVTDEYAQAWNVESIAESNARRRFLSIQAVREATA